MPQTILEHITDEDLTIDVNQLDTIEYSLAAKGLVDFEGIRSTNIVIIQINKTLQILSTKELHEEGDRLRKAGAKIFTYEAPFIPHEAQIRAKDLQNLKALPGSDETEPMLQQEVVMETLDDMDENYSTTYEFIIMNMLKGKIMKNKTDVLVDLYALFDKDPITLDFKFSDENTDVMALVTKLDRMIRKGAKGDIVTGSEAQVSEEWFDALVGHKSVKDAYSAYNGNNNMLVEGTGNRFKFGPVTFEVNSTEVDDYKFVETGKGHAYPLGTRKTFKGTLSPADMTPYANTKGQRLYVSTEDLKHKKGIDIHMESRPAGICRNLDSLVTLTKS